jgi:hypothetical protein
MNRDIVLLVRASSPRRRNRWYGSGVSACLAQFETGEARRKQAVNFDKLLGLATVLAVVTLAWTALGLAVSHFLR